MDSVLIILLIGIASVAGIWYIYKRDDDEDETKKLIAVMIALVICLSTAFMVYDAKTRDIALATGDNTAATLAILLGWNSGGYSPYIKESWGGTDPQDDFDWDGIKNEWDMDADNDGLNDNYEPLTRFNPFEPNIGIQHMDVKWLADNKISILCEPVEQTTVYDCFLTLYHNNIEIGKQMFFSPVTFNLEFDLNESNTFELRVEGVESDYANKADNFRSYTIPIGIFGIIGIWYSEAELEYQGIIRNNPLFYSNNAFSIVDSLIRETMAGIPLIFWIIIIAFIVILLVIQWRRRVKGKPPLFSWGRKKKERTFSPGDKVIRLY